MRDPAHIIYTISKRENPGFESHKVKSMEVRRVELLSEKASAKITTSVVHILFFARDKALDGANLKLDREKFPAIPREQGRAVSG